MAVGLFHLSAMLLAAAAAVAGDIAAAAGVASKLGDKNCCMMVVA